MNYNTVKFIIYFSGLYSIALAIFRIFFWKLFRLKRNLEELNLANKAIIQIFNSSFIYIFLSIGIVCFTLPKELLSSKLGNVFLLAISLFWIGQTIQQFFFLKIKDKMVSVLSAVFIFGAILFASPVILKLAFFKPCKVLLKKS